MAGEEVRLRERKSRAIEIFRTTPPKTVCPNFYVLSHANGCAFGPQCEYCYLKSSFWYLGGRQEAFSNVEGMIAETGRWIEKDGLESYVLNSGNLSDSLAFEEARPLVGELVELFREKAEKRGRPHTLLVVTKGGMRECATLFAREACRNVIVSFSVNSNEAAAQYERGAATVEDRLEAARRLKKAGWRVRMRIDPMIAGFDYGEVVRALAALAPERVTLGTLRAEASLLKTVDHGMFSELAAPETEGGLARYPREVRMGLYGPAIKVLAKVCECALCEETEDVWRELGLDTEAKRCNCAL